MERQAEGWKNGQNQLHRTLPAIAGGPTNKHQITNQ